jgi:formylglycine-generating enzyme required for sulfatase activity
MSRIFLSHSSANNVEAVALRDWLATQGFDEIFLDLDPNRGLKAGERWEQALIAAANRCEAVVFLVSQAWIASAWCRKEMVLAHRLNKRMFGVLIEELSVDEVPEDLSGEWQLVRLASGRDGIELTAVLPVTHEEETVTFSAEGLQRLKHGLESAGLDPKYFAWPPANDPGRPPYRGFLPLEAEDAGIFFGRDAAIITALDALRGMREAAPPRLFVLLGASGTGKSSVLRAGLIPRLKRDDRHFLPMPVIRPERAAVTGEAGLLHALEAALKDKGLARARADLRTTLAAGPEAVRGLLQELAAKATVSTSPDSDLAPKPPTLVLSIDQGEELFNADGAEEARQLLDLIAALVSAPAPDVIAVFTIRTDAYEPLQSAQGPAAPLADLKQVTLSLPPMARGAYQSVIEGPAARLAQSGRKLDIAPELTAALLRDIEEGGAKDALPLLAFTLERLYLEHGGDGKLTLAKYEALGGIKGAIEAAVQQAFKAADANPAVPRDDNARRKLLRRGLIPWLAGIDPETGSPRRKVARLTQIPAESRPLIDLLVEVRLLATDRDAATGEATIEPAHEALLRQWGLLEDWLEEDSAALAVLEGVKRAARDWEANAKRAAWLAHTGTRLNEAERTAELPAFADYLAAGDRDYLNAAQKAEAASRRKARRTQAAIYTLLIGILVGFVAYTSQDFLKEQYVWRVVMRPSVLTAAQETEKAASPGPNTAFAECANGCPTMTVVPEGKYTMGAWRDVGAADETPPHEVTIPKPFAVSRTEITFDQWEACVAATGCPELFDNYWGRDDRPAILLTWEEAKQYAAWLSKLTGKEYRLLSEAEWEYAARAGNPDQWTFADKAQYTWFVLNSGGKTQPVGNKEPNAFGLHDMSGNVWEWVEDCYADYRTEPRDGSPVTSGDCSRRVIRGGSWGDDPIYLRAASRSRRASDFRGNAVGFRVARTLPAATGATEVSPGEQETTGADTSTADVDTEPKPDLVIAGDTQLALSARNGKTVAGSCKLNEPLWEGKIALKNIGPATLPARPERELGPAILGPAMRIGPDHQSDWPHVRAYVPTNSQLHTQARLANDLGAFAQEAISLEIGREMPKCRNYDAPPVFDERLSGRPELYGASGSDDCIRGINHVPIYLEIDPERQIAGENRSNNRMQFTVAIDCSNVATSNPDLVFTEDTQLALSGRAGKAVVGSCQVEDPLWEGRISIKNIGGAAVLAGPEQQDRLSPIMSQDLPPHVRAYVPTNSELKDEKRLGNDLGESGQEFIALSIGENMPKCRASGSDDCARGINLVPLYLEIDPDRQIPGENRSNNRAQFIVAIDCSNVAK